MLKKIKDERGQLGNPVVAGVAIAVVAFLFIEGIGIIDVVDEFGQPKGNTEVNIGMVASNGDRKSLESDPAFFADTTTFYVVDDSGDRIETGGLDDSSAFVGPSGTEFQELFGELWVTAKTDSSGQDVDLTVHYRVELESGELFHSGSFDKTIKSGDKTMVKELRITTADLLGEMAVGSTRIAKWKYEVEANYNNKTADTIATGSIEISHVYGGELSISTDFTSGTTLSFTN